MKQQLMKLEDRGSGRVRLPDFYGSKLHGGKWQFAESVAYLRQLGALDESNPHNMGVIIPNYINGASNCIASSEYVSVCCISECEVLREQLEDGLGVPEAMPADIAALVAALPSASVPANRSLSPVMLHRLNGIAVGHGGRVPLYGRLFAQWLHHAYPRECPYPHLAGTTKPEPLSDKIRENGLKSATVSPKEMEENGAADAAKLQQSRLSRPVEHARWSHEEELFVPEAATAENPVAFMLVHGAVFVALFAVFAFGRVMLQMARGARDAAQVRPAMKADQPEFLQP